MNTTSPDPLAALRPIHAPPPVSWWPPAPGWWILAVALCFAAAGVILWYLRARPRRAALRELRALQARDLTEREFASSVSTILKRYALHCFPPHEVASLTGRKWLEFLDDRASAGGFMSGPGSVLGDMPYSVDGSIDGSIDKDKLLHLAERWIMGVRPGDDRRSGR